MIFNYLLMILGGWIIEDPLHGVSPAHADIQNYFKVSPPPVNQMLITLEKKSLIQNQLIVAKSIKRLIPIEKLPLLK